MIKRRDNKNVRIHIYIHTHIYEKRKVIHVEEISLQTNTGNG